jgi:hypothetical protein
MDYKRCRILRTHFRGTGIPPEDMPATLASILSFLGLPAGTTLREFKRERLSGALLLKVVNPAWPVVPPGERIPYHCENGEAC